MKFKHLKNCEKWEREWELQQKTLGNILVNGGKKAKQIRDLYNILK